jgi:hypothetical protein
MGRVVLEGQDIPIIGEALENPITPFGAIFGTGEQKRSDLSLAKPFAFEDFKGGIGVEFRQDAGQRDRFADQVGINTLKGWEFMLETERQTTAIASGVTAAMGIEFNSGLNLVGDDGKVYRWNKTTSVWDEVDTPPAAPTDMMLWTEGTSEYLVIAYGTGYMHSTDGTTFTDETTDVKYMTTYDGFMIFYDDVGRKIRKNAVVATPSPTNIATETQGDARGLTVFRDQDGQPSIWFSSTRGLFQIDYANASAYYVYDYSSTPYANNGKNMLEYNGLLYFPVGQELIAISPQGNVISIGPNRDDGLINSDHGNYITNLMILQNFLVILNRSSTKAAVLVFDGSGWHVQTSGLSNSDALFHETTTGTDEPRLWVGNGANSMVYQAFNDQSERKLPFTGQTFESSGTLTTYWETFGFPEFEKAIFQTVVHGRDFTDDDYVQIEYQTNNESDSNEWRSLERTVGTEDRQLFDFAGGEGIMVTNLRLRATLTRSTTDKSKTPKVDAIIVKFLAKPEERLGWTFTIPIGEKSVGDMDGKQAKTWLRSLAEKGTNIRFIPTGERDDEGYWVQITNGPFILGAGENATAQLTVAVPV